MDPHDTLAQIVQHLAVAQTYLTKAAVLVARYQETISPSGASLARKTNSAIHSLQAWAEHLGENGPTTRGDLHEATGLNLTQSGYNRTQAWAAPMTYMADDALPADAVLRIKGTSDGVGRPPVIYFLWAQRWDVLTKFGTGPIKPTNFEAGLHSDVVVPDAHPENRGNLVFPVETDETLDWSEPASDETEWVPTHCSTMAEWDELHSALFDAMVGAESKPNDEQKQLLRLTVPEGEDANAAIAIAYRNATLRARSITGVIQPPVSAHPILPANGEEIPIDWDS